MLLVDRYRFGLLGAVGCFFVPAAPVCARWYLPAAFGLAGVIPFRVIGQLSWANSPAWFCDSVCVLI